MTATKSGPVPIEPRNPPAFIAWQVTAENIPEVAEWAGAPLLGRDSPNPHIVLKRGWPAYVGDWVIATLAEGGWQHRRHTAEEFDQLYRVVP